MARKPLGWKPGVREYSVDLRISEETVILGV